MALKWGCSDPNLLTKWADAPQVPLGFSPWDPGGHPPRMNFMSLFLKGNKHWEGERTQQIPITKGDQKFHSHHKSRNLNKMAMVVSSNFGKTLPEN